MLHFTNTYNIPANFQRPVRRYSGLDPEHRVDPAALRSVQLVQGLGHEAGVVLEQGFLVLLELPYLLLAAPECPQLLVRGSPDFIELGYACPEFVKADEVFGGHLLVAGFDPFHLGGILPPSAARSHLARTPYG